MYPWLRLFRVGLGVIGQPKVNLLATTRIRVRVWPNDLDFNLHVNNGRYLTLADLGRLHWFARTGLLAMARRERALPIVGDVIAKFRRELKPFETFEIQSRLVGWDEKWAFLEHRFVRTGRVLGTVTIRGVFKGPNGPLKPQTLLDALAHTDPSPPLPRWVRDFQNSSELASEALRNEERAKSPDG